MYVGALIGWWARVTMEMDETTPSVGDPHDDRITMMQAAAHEEAAGHYVSLPTDDDFMFADYVQYDAIMKRSISSQILTKTPHS